MSELTLDNLHFTNHCPPGRPHSVMNVTRVSDGHFLRPQVWFERYLTEDELEEAAKTWLAQNPGLNDEPAEVKCYACGEVLVSDFDTDYQFDNALWIGLHGGYGMFVDSCDFPLNAEDAWLKQDGLIVRDDDGQLVRDPDWVAQYEEVRILAGRPDLEAVICHTCAHALCEQVPWFAKLIEPERSHAHRVTEHEALKAQGHVGWDLDRD